MPLTVIETPADPTANSYVTLAEADDYMATRLHSEAWATFTEDQKSAAIISATSWLDTCFNWTGTPTTTTQRLGWPRTGMFTRNNVPIDSMELPFDLKKATAEFSFSLASAERTADNDAANQGIAEMKAGPVAIKFFDQRGSNTQISYMNRVIPDSVRALIPPSWYTHLGLDVIAETLDKSFFFMVSR